MSQPTYEVRKRYRDKAIRRIVIDLPKAFANDWEKKLEKDGLTKAGFVKAAIREYLEEPSE